jgi:hypothetical protein
LARLLELFIGNFVLGPGDKPTPIKMIRQVMADNSTLLVAELELLVQRSKACAQVGVKDDLRHSHILGRSIAPTAL